MIRLMLIAAALAGAAAHADSGLDPDLDECRAQVADYAYYWDHNDADGMAGVFTPDATLTLGDQTFTGPEAIVGRMQAREAGSVIRHLMTTVHVERTGADSARGVSYVSIYMGRQPDQGLTSVDGFALMGEYHDTFAVNDGDCRIAERRLVPVLRRPAEE
jgi:hypothetical protein